LGDQIYSSQQLVSVNPTLNAAATTQHKRFFCAPQCATRSTPLAFPDLSNAHTHTNKKATTHHHRFTASTTFTTKPRPIK
jgi:hypothetical protein